MKYQRRITLLFLLLISICSSDAVPRMSIGDIGLSHKVHKHVVSKIDIDSLIRNYSTKKMNSSPISKLRHVLSTRHTNRQVSKQQQQQCGRHRRRHHHHHPKDGGGFGSCGKRLLFGSSNNFTRTRIMRSLPSPKQLHRVMFHGSNSLVAGLSSMQLQFNNEDVGMTKPSLDNIQYTNRMEEKEKEKEKEDSFLIDEDFSSSSCGLWWPQSSATTIALPSSKGWRVKTYRRRVGRGEACYNLVKNAALDWEFTDNNESSSFGPNTGIVRAIPSSSTRLSSGIPENTSSNVLQIWSSTSSSPSYCSNDSSPVLMGMNMRKLATFTKMSLFSGLQKQLQGLPFSLGSRIRIPSISMYVVNPTAVIYDLIDEKAPPSIRGRDYANVGVGSTFTSTAYATLKGHLLCGEERVTVILRDEIGNDDDVGSGDCLSSSLPIPKESATRSSKSARTPKFTSSSCSLMDDLSYSISTPNTGGYVDVEIVSYSKAAPSILGRLVWPFIGKKQDEFFRCEMDALERVANTAEGGSTFKIGQY